MWQNYHKHSDISNTRITDSVVKNEAYAKRAVELGQQIISSCEHGSAGDYRGCYELAKKYDLKWRYVAEVYFVIDRHEKDQTNAHMILAARTEKGIGDLNEVISEANLTGFYGRPRVDMELLMTLNPKDVFVTTACLAGIWSYGKYVTDDGQVRYDFTLPDRLVGQLKGHFGDSFMLEVQYHNTQVQKIINQHILQLYRNQGIPVIFGCDSHYIYPEEKAARDARLAANKIQYDDEDGLDMDYPDEDTVIQRFTDQGVLPLPIVKEALDNTNVFLQFEDVEFEFSKKVPTIYPQLTQEERNQKFTELIRSLWLERRPSIPRDRWSEYQEGIKYELDTIVETNMSDYFLLNYKIIKRFKELGGHLTYTGRGSAPSYYINNLLGFTSIDRFSSPITMYPDRFISKDRLLSGSLPDIDQNVAEQDIFARAQAEVMGEWHSAPMCAFGTMKVLSAFKMYCRAENVPFDVANAITDQLKKYELDLKYADEDDEEEISPYNYVSEEYHDVLRQSEKYQGVIDSISPHPCGYVLCDKDIRREIGIIRLKPKAGSDEPTYAAFIDGATAERFGYLKNDNLGVTVVKLIAKIYERIGIPQPTVPELIKLCENNEPTWSMYARGLTLGLNQAEKEKSTKKVMKYKPHNLSETSAYVAAIRPGFSSMLDKFLSREHFDYGIPALDKLLQTPEMPNSFLLYQELMMKVMQYAGFTAPESYSAIKAIAKKHPEKVLPLKEKFLVGFTDKLKEDGTKEQEASEAAQKVWQICSDACQYSFNSCLTGDTKLFRGRGRNSHEALTIEEMYRIKNDKQYAESTGHKDLSQKYRSYGYGKALSLCSDGRIRINKIVDIYYQGKRPVYMLTTESGATVKCTANHKFPIKESDEMVKLEDLKIGQTVFLKGQYEKAKNTHRFTKGSAESNCPKKNQLGFQKRENAPSVVFKTERERCVTEELPCVVCNTPYSLDQHFELHHADGDSTNNTLSNFMWVCNSCHKKLHYQGLKRRRQYEKGIPSLEDKIVSIEYAGEEDVYDVEMEAPNHNFVLDNGLIVGNSHSVATALDSMYCAYAKGNYPLETYAAMLDIYSERGDKDKIDRCKAEMKQGFGISIAPCKFGQDNRSTFIDREHNAISDRLVSMKGIGHQIADILYELGKEKWKYSHFIDLVFRVSIGWNITDDPRLRGIDDELPVAGMKIQSNVMEALIKADYFEEYGGSKKLLTLYDEFKNGKNKLTTSLKAKNFGTRYKALINIEETLPNESISPYEKVKFEGDVFGSPKAVYPELKGEYYVLDVTNERGVRVNMYSMSTGKLGVMRVKASDFKKYPIEKGEAIRILKWKKDYANRKDANGDWVKDYNRPELWLQIPEKIPLEQISLKT